MNAEEIKEITTALAQMLAAGFLKLVSDVMRVVEKNAADRLVVDKALLKLREEEVEIQREQVAQMTVIANAAIFWQDHRNDVGGGAT
jgi:hypothetical protein